MPEARVRLLCDMAVVRTEGGDTGCVGILVPAGHVELL